MLLNVHPNMTPDILRVLMTMGHGDTIALVDSNFPAAAVARSTHVIEPFEWTLDAIAALKTLLVHFPIDTYEPEIPAVQGMAVVDMPNEIPAVVAEAAPLFKARDQTVALVERMEFYERAKNCFAVIRTTETRPYGNFLIRKGVVSPA